MTIQEVAAPERRQRRWHQAHDRLYEAACELFLQNGYLGTSVDDIAERADVARKTAFNHFSRKQDFVREWGSRRRRQVLSALSSDLIADPELEVVLRHYFAELVAINLDQRALTICMSAGWRASGGAFDGDPHQLVDVFREFIGDALARGEVPAAVDADRLGMVLYSSYFGLLYEWCGGTVAEPPFDLGAAYSQLLDVFLAGIRSL